MKKTVTYLERPFFIYGKRVHSAIPERIEIHNSKPIYTFIMVDNSKYVIHEKDVYETFEEAKKHL